jgi:hypothetical protein
LSEFNTKNVNNISFRTSGDLVSDNSLKTRAYKVRAIIAF